MLFASAPTHFSPPLPRQLVCARVPPLFKCAHHTHQSSSHMPSPPSPHLCTRLPSLPHPVLPLPSSFASYLTCLLAYFHPPQSFIPLPLSLLTIHPVMLPCRFPTTLLPLLLLLYLALPLCAQNANPANDYVITLPEPSDLSRMIRSTAPFSIPSPLPSPMDARLCRKSLPSGFALSCRATKQLPQLPIPKQTPFAAIRAKVSMKYGRLRVEVAIAKGRGRIKSVSWGITLEVGRPSLTKSFKIPRNTKRFVLRADVLRTFSRRPCCDSMPIFQAQFTSCLRGKCYETGLFIVIRNACVRCTKLELTKPWGRNGRCRGC